MDVQQLTCDNKRTETVRKLKSLGYFIEEKMRFREPTIPFLDKGSSEDPHEPSQTHQLHPKFFQHAINGAIELCAAAV